MLKNLEKEADKFSDKKLGEKFRHRYTASYTIICAHLLGYPIPKVLKGIHKRVVTKAPFIL